MSFNFPKVGLAMLRHNPRLITFTTRCTLELSQLIMLTCRARISGTTDRTVGARTPHGLQSLDLQKKKLISGSCQG
jgi:hypothetical protein